MFLFKQFTRLTPLISKAFLPFPQYSFSYFCKTERTVKDLTPKQLSDPKKIKEILKTTHLARKTKQSQRGLFHKKQVRTGNRTCFSEKKSKRKWWPNIQKKPFYSEILGRRLTLEVTTKTIKCIRKYNGFDNYILLTKPENLDSIYGEYLRKLMITKLNDPTFKTPYLTKANDFTFKHLKRRFLIKPLVYYPPHMRDADKTVYELKDPSDMNREDLKKFNDICLLMDKHEDIPTNHPYLKELELAEQEDLDKLEPDRIKIEEKMARMKRKQLNNTLVEYHNQAVEDFFKDDSLPYVTVREQRKKKK